MQCDNCQAETAVLLVSNTSNGDSIAVGANCVPTWAVTTAAAATTPEELVSIVFELLGIDPDTHDGADTVGEAEPLGVVTDPLAEPDTATDPETPSLLTPTPEQVADFTARLEAAADALDMNQPAPARD